MQELVSTELLNMLFPNLDQILEYHVLLNQAMKKRRKEESLVTRVGDILVNQVRSFFYILLHHLIKFFLLRLAYSL